ncbi:MAG: transposase [Acidobacteriia bacterium]|nr:transposase [Terriglobia bacterium]
MARKRKSNPKSDQRTGASLLSCLNLNAAGVDIGATEIYIAVPGDRDPQPVRCFSTFTEDLHAAAAWLKACHIETVAMESTGVYWIPLFQILEARGFKVLLVNAHHVKKVPGRKSDVSDCQWLQYLHSVGLLRGSFRTMRRSARRTKCRIAIVWKPGSGNKPASSDYSLLPYNSTKFLRRSRICCSQILKMGDRAVRR